MEGLVSTASQLPQPEVTIEPELEAMMYTESGEPDPAIDENCQWQSLTTLHTQLLDKYYHFFLASQNSSGSSLMGLAVAYGMPIRFCRHGISACLETLRRGLPRSTDHMLTFIKSAYNTLALLHHGVPAFQVTWDACMGYLASYRAHIGITQETREAWISEAQFWYTTISDRCPSLGYMYHYQAVLASTWLERLSLLKKCVACSPSYPNGHSETANLFMRVHEGHRSFRTGFEKLFFQSHQNISLLSDDSIRTDPSLMKRLLNDFIISQGTNFNKIGMHVAITNITTVISCNAFEPCLDVLLQINEMTAPNLKLTSQLKQRSVSEASADLGGAFEYLSMDESSPSQRLTQTTKLNPDQSKILSAFRIMFAVLNVALSHPRCSNVLSLVHITLAFCWSVSQQHQTIVYSDMPWLEICDFMNSWSLKIDIGATVIWPYSIPAKPLPEDFLIRGLAFSYRYFPHTWFDNAPTHDERYLEAPSVTTARLTRVLWLVQQIAKVSDAIIPFFRC